MRRLEGSGAADCVVLGAGFTGLAAARRLAEARPDWRVVLVEAQRAGFGASGRSSGFLVELGVSFAVMKPDDSARIVDLSRRGIAHLRSLTREHGIECAWDDRGWLQGAAGDAGGRNLDLLESWLRKIEAPHEVLDAPALEALTGTSFYHRGVRLTGSPLVHSGALVRGLVQSLPRTVELFEDSPVLRFQRRAGEWELSTPEGGLTTPRLIVAANGYAPDLGVLKRRIFPLYTFAGLTRRLEPEEQALVGAEDEWGLVAQDPLGSSLRRTRDQRLLVRNSVYYPRRLALPRAVRSRAARDLRGALERRYPELAQRLRAGDSDSSAFEYEWAGLMGVSKTQDVIAGPVGEGLWASGGFSGTGIVLGTQSGRALADLASGADTDLARDFLALPRPPWIPPQPFLGMGIRWTLASQDRRGRGTL